MVLICFLCSAKRVECSLLSLANTVWSSLKVTSSISFFVKKFYRLPGSIFFWRWIFSHSLYKDCCQNVDFLKVERYHQSNDITLSAMVFLVIFFGPGFHSMTIHLWKGHSLNLRWSSSNASKGTQSPQFSLGFGR